jgi:NAD(P)-dependent dehydrogenase (short-subunit alcohol dehydrogenase family)
VLIVGASRGIGAAIARACRNNGARLVLASRDKDALSRLTDELDPTGRDVVSIQADITNGRDLEAAVSLAKAKFGRLDCAVNNAGVQTLRLPLAELPEEAFDALMAVNLRGVFVAMKHELKAMLEAGAGSIVNVSSTAGIAAFPLIGAYAASKQAVIGLTRTAAVEYAPKGIRVNALAPGMVMTEMLKGGPAATPERTAQTISKIPMARIAGPEEAAAAAVWLASDSASYVTGTTLVVDGGYTAV